MSWRSERRTSASAFLQFDAAGRPEGPVGLHPTGGATFFSVRTSLVRVKPASALQRPISAVRCKAVPSNNPPKPLCGGTRRFPYVNAANAYSPSKPPASITLTTPFSAATVTARPCQLSQTSRAAIVSKTPGSNPQIYSSPSSVNTPPQPPASARTFVPAGRDSTCARVITGWPPMRSMDFAHGAMPGQRCIQSRPAGFVTQ